MLRNIFLTWHELPHAFPGDVAELGQHDSEIQVGSEDDDVAEGSGGNPSPTLSGFSFNFEGSI